MFFVFYPFCLAILQHITLSGKGKSQLLSFTNPFILHVFLGAPGNSSGFTLSA